MYFKRQDHDHETTARSSEAEASTCLFDPQSQNLNLQIAGVFIVLFASLLGVLVPMVLKPKVRLIK